MKNYLLWWFQVVFMSVMLGQVRLGLQRSKAGHTWFGPCVETREEQSCPHKITALYWTCHSNSSLHVLSLDFSGLHQPVLSLDESDCAARTCLYYSSLCCRWTNQTVLPGLVFITVACAAPGRIRLCCQVLSLLQQPVLPLDESDCAARTCLYYSSLGCPWTLRNSDYVFLRKWQVFTGIHSRCKK
jgi:hypothetical protein